MTRWILSCTLGEAIGIALVATAYAAADRGLVPAAPAILAAGACEGLALGLAQALLLRRVGICAGCWVTMTMTGALLGYGLTLLGGPPASDAPDPPLALILAGGAALGAVMGVLMGALQSLPGRPAIRPRSWILRSALGWALAMPPIFLAATAVPAGAPLALIALAGCLSGAVAGALLGLATAPALPLALTRPPL